MGHRLLSWIGTVPVVTTNSFSTIQPPNGTSPTASSPTDTLTFTSSDSSITITGDSSSDTIDFTINTSLAGDVDGPSSSTDNAIVRFDGTTGKLIQNSTVTLSDDGMAANLLLSDDSCAFVVAADPTKKMWFNLGSFTSGGIYEIGMNMTGSGTFILRLPDGTAGGSADLVDTMSSQNLQNKNFLDSVTSFYSSNSNFCQLFFEVNDNVDGSVTNLVIGTTGAVTRNISFPDSGSDWSVVGADLTQTLTNKTIDADANTITNIENADIKASAGIVYSKLNLTGGIVNADVNASAAIAYSKLNLAGSIVNADVNASAAIAYSKLNLSGSIVNADVNASAAITYSKLNLSSSIVNADISSSAAIAFSKLATLTSGNVIYGVTNVATSTALNTIAVTSVAKSGDTPLVGAVTFSEGSNITLTQTGNDISIASTGGGGAPTDATYVTLTTNGTLSNERVLTGTADQVTITDGGAGSTVTLSLPQSIATTSSPSFTGLTLQTLTLTGSTASNFINASGTLDAATGAENAYVLDFTVNKATSGAATGLKINMTDTSSPDTCYLMDLQKAASSKFRVDENGNLETSNITGTAGSGITVNGGSASGADLKLRSTSHATPGNVQIMSNILFDGTIFKTSASSFTIRDVINRDILVVNATDMFINDVPVTIEQDTTITANIFLTPPAASGTVDPVMTLTAPAHTALTASTEFHDLLIDLDRTVQWSAGNLALQRALYIPAPTYDTTALSTFTEAITVAIGGPPTVGASALQVTTAVGFKMEQVAIPSSVSTGIGFVIYAPTTAGASTVSVGSFMDGNLGVNTLTPGTYLDLKVPVLTSAGNDISCIDGTTRFCGMYVGGTSIVSAPGGGTSGFILDFGWAPTSNSAFALSANQTFMSLEGSVNMSGATSCGIFTLDDRGSGGTTTNSRALVATYRTISGSTRAVTTGRAFLTNANLSGSGTVTTFVGVDQLLTIGASNTTTTAHQIRINSPSVSGTLSNYDAILVEENTATIGSRNTQLRILGASLEARIECNLMVGSDASPTLGKVQVAGNLAIANAGLLKMYESGSGNFTSFQAGTQSADIAYVLPTAQGGASEVLTNDGSGNLSWAAAGGSGSSVDTYIKTADTTSSNDTFTNDSVMAGMTLATGRYTLEGFFWITAGSTTPDFKFQMVETTSTINDFKLFWKAVIASGATQEGFLTTMSTTSGVINVAASGQTVVRITGSIDVTNAGSLAVQWAQNTSSGGTPVTLAEGSWFRLVKD